MILKKNIEGLARDLLLSVSTMIDFRLEAFKANKKKKAVILTVNGDGTANIKMNDDIYENIKIRTGLSLSANNIVWVEIPNGNMSDMYIDIGL